MNEITTEIMTRVFGAAEAAIQPLILRRAFGRKPDAPFAALFTVLNAIAYLLPLPLFAGLLTSLTGVTLYCRFALRASRRESALYGALSSVILWLCYGITDSLLCALTAAANPRSLQVGTIVFILGNIFPLAAYWVVCSAACGLIKNSNPAARELTLMIPLLPVFVTEIYIVRTLYGMPEEVSAGGNIAALLVQIIGTASVFCILSVYQKLADNSEKLRLYIECSRRDREYADYAEAYCSSARSLNHDMKNHLAVIGGLLRKERYQNALEYVSKLDNARESVGIKYHTGCRILDMILTDKLSDFACKTEINCKTALQIDETDICVIFANAIDNAVSAVSKLPESERIISLSTEKRGELLFIRIENSFDGSPFKSGTGINNIVSAAERYGGAAEISARGNRFVLKLILRNSQQ